MHWSIIFLCCNQRIYVIGCCFIVHDLPFRYGIGRNQDAFISLLTWTTGNTNISSNQSWYCLSIVPKIGTHAQSKIYSDLNLASASNFNPSSTAMFLSSIFHFALLQLWQTELQIDWARYEVEREGWVMGAARQISTCLTIKANKWWIES